MSGTAFLELEFKGVKDGCLLGAWPSWHSGHKGESIFVEPEYNGIGYWKEENGDVTGRVFVGCETGDKLFLLFPDGHPERKGKTIRILKSLSMKLVAEIQARLAIAFEVPGDQVKTAVAMLGDSIVRTGKLSAEMRDMARGMFEAAGCAERTKDALAALDRHFDGKGDRADLETVGRTFRDIIDWKATPFPG